MNRHTRRATLATITAGLLCTLTMLGGPAFAKTGGVKGSPQPELKSFKIGASGGGGSVALEPNGDVVVAYSITAGSGETRVCLLNRGSHKCTHTTTLSPLSGDDLFGETYAFVSSANHVEVLQTDCCDASSLGGDLLFSSTDGGKTFGAPVRVGDVTADAAALVGSNILFLGDDDGGGAQVESVGINGAVGGTANPITQEAINVGVSSYHNGALVAADDDGSPDTTRVAYAAAGSSFGSSSAYHIVGTFPNQSFVGISGGALLTEKTTGNESLELRLFNGSGFGAEHAVPHTAGGGPEWFAVDQDPSGKSHVFSESTHLARDYDLYEESTSTGSHWSGPLNLGNAISADNFAIGLDSRGSGLVLGTDPAIGFPVLGNQSVSFSLKHSSIRKGRSTTGSGKGSPGGSGRKVELQVERSGRWYDVASTHENSSGSFKFTIKGTAAGRHTYRAVASDLAGYLLYGYSPARTLRVTS